MQNNPFAQARRICLWLAAAVCLGFLTGCDEVRITNLTPTSLPENPSQIYTISARITTHTPGYIQGSLQPRIVVDGQNFAMQRSPLGADIYEFDYQVQPGRGELAYYILAPYKVEYNGAVTQREVYTGVSRVSIVGRYVLSLEVNRGPVGARVSVLGRGFSPQDVVYFDNIPARTVFESANSMSFFVPAVDANRNYRVQLSSAAGTSVVGTFRVDASSLSVFPTSLLLRTGESQALTFTLPSPAPTGGLLLDVTTDIPDSVIMPEVIVPAGSTSVTINVQGGRPGNGNLYLKGFGVGELTVGVTVQ
ncbi:hypothetical protein MASR2M8_15630 [Opitutaceae bacterium]